MQMGWVIQPPVSVNISRQNIGTRGAAASSIAFLLTGFLSLNRDMQAINAHAYLPGRWQWFQLSYTYVVCVSGNLL